MISLLANFFNYLDFIIEIYNMVFLVWILSTWLPFDRSNFLLKFVDNLINPVYSMLLKTFPPLHIGIMDFSPFYMFIFLIVIEKTVDILRLLTYTMFVS